MHDDMTPTYWALRAEQAPPKPGGRHRWLGAPQAVPASEHGPRHSIDADTEEMVLWPATRIPTETDSPTTD